ncbi:hypothetical protein FB567DRAFT_603899 [Paraphoma chrysanthemicola]|uniref:Uncharacterized protein n=1 Tax=Paraphoma chrysanthemicola TaxID=798071 RepID=A0A8K0R593_9PLEO|nr:hypothetical protein FB567DRAFT_603899 [Paraphoma chrysanthemicola]
MISIFNYACCLSLLVATVYSGTLNFGCNQGTEDRDLKEAVADVEELSKVAAAALLTGKINGKEDVFLGAFDPLFTAGDKAILHIRLSSAKSQRRWEDTAYVNKAGTKLMYIPISGSVSNKPGTRGSYTTIGFKYNDEYDTSGSAHVYIAEERRHPPADDKYDRRRYPDIVKDGLDGKHNMLEEIKPLAQTVLHEFIHAIGGMILPDPGNVNDKTKRRPRINDGPTKDTYGWLKCNQRRAQGLSNIDIADCITFLGQAIFLQFQGKDTYWTTVEVDPATLLPKNLPKP